jgi:hypothetical protein
MSFGVDCSICTAIASTDIENIIPNIYLKEEERI